MGFYDDHIVPHLIDLSMRHSELLPYRKRLLAGGRGRVLEIGVGSGLNLPHYPARAREIVGLEPSARLVAMAQRRAQLCTVPVSLITGSAESIPADAHSFDTVITAWTLCSIGDAIRALREVRRVLKPEGQLLFVEHGLAPDGKVQRWQHRLTPLWKKFGGGCHLNRPICALIESAGFEIASLETGYANGAKALAFFYEGSARPISG